MNTIRKLFLVLILIQSIVFASEKLSYEVQKMLGEEVTNKAQTRQKKSAKNHRKKTKAFVTLHKKKKRVKKHKTSSKSNKSNNSNIFYIIISMLVLYGFYQITSTLKYLNKSKVTKKQKSMHSDDKTKEEMHSRKKEPIGRENKGSSEASISTDKALIAIYTKVAKSDGYISQNEANAIMKLINYLENIYKNQMGNVSSNIYRNSLVKMHKIAKDDDKSIEFYAKIVHQNFSTKEQENIFSKLASFSKISKKSHKKTLLLYIVGEILSLNEQKIKYYIGSFEEQQKEPSRQMDSYAILECSSSDDCQKIKSNWKKLMLGVHPDKIKSKGLDKQMMEFAEQKAKELNAAYADIKKRRNC